MGCATGMVKYLVFLANLVFVLAGLGLVAIGVIFKYQYLNNVAEDAVPDEFGVAPMLSIIVGAVVFITAFFGCCGAIRESTCMLTTYAVILLSIFIIQVALGVYALLQVKDNGDYRSQLGKAYRKTFDNYERRQADREAIDLTQKFLQCCGVEGPHDYHFSNGSVPQSCCNDLNKNNCSPTNSYPEGCVQALFNFLEKSAKVLGYIIIGIAVTEILGAFFGLCLASSIRNQYRRNIYA